MKGLPEKMGLPTYELKIDNRPGSVDVGMEPSPTGTWVKLEDYAAALGERVEALPEPKIYPTLNGREYVIKEDYDLLRERLSAALEEVERLKQK